MPIRLAKYAFTLLLFAWLTGPATAQLCTASIADVDFGSIDVTANTVTDGTTTLSMTCTGTPGQILRICVNLGEGSGGADSGLARRHLFGNSGQQINFNIFSNAARSVILGSAGTAGAGPLALQRTFNNNGRINISRTLYTRIYSGQQTASVGAYSSIFAGNNVRITYDYNTSQTCDSVMIAAEVNPSFTAMARIVPRCTVNATNLDFGTVGILSAERLATNTLYVVCTTSAPYSISLDGGLSGAANPSQRLMRSGTNTLTYGLYRDPSRSLPWGGNVGVDTLSATGIGSTQRFTVFGKVPIQPTPAPGVYSDTVVVTVTY